MDPRALGNLLVQVRDLLRHHQRIGIRFYPEKERLAHLFTGRRRPSATSRKQSPVREAVPSDSGSSALHLDAVHKMIRQCRTCSGQERTPVVPAHPRKRPVSLVVIGDWCRADRAAGQRWCDRDEDDMLARMMKAIGVDMGGVYATNIVKCPGQEEAPDQKTVQRCLGHLERELAAVRARVVLAMGEFAVANLLGAEQPLVRLRGRFYQRVVGGQNTLIMPTFHPHFLLQHEEMKKPAWQDLLRLKGYLSENTV